MKNLLLIIAVAFLLVNCSNGNKKLDTVDKQPSPLEEFKEQVTDIVPQNQGSVQDINTFVRMSGASFMPEIVNNPHSVQKYKETMYLAAANLGIYTTDVLYQAAYKRGEGARLSYGAAKELAFHVGVGEVFDEIVLQRLEEGGSKDDSIVYKLTTALDNSKTVLREKDQARLLTAITIGSFVQKLYVTNNIIFNYPEDLPVESKLLVLRQSIMLLSVQIKQAVELTELFKTYKPKTEKAAEIYKIMKEISAIYEPMRLEENIESIEAKQIFENAELLKAFDKVKEVRSMLILEE